MKIRVRRRGTEQIRAQGRFFPGEPVVKVAIQVSADPQRPATGRRGYIVRQVVEIIDPFINRATFLRRVHSEECKKPAGNFNLNINDVLTDRPDVDNIEFIISLCTITATP